MGPVLPFVSHILVGDIAGTRIVDATT